MVVDGSVNSSSGDANERCPTRSASEHGMGGSVLYRTAVVVQLHETAASRSYCKRRRAYQLLIADVQLQFHLIEN